MENFSTQHEVQNQGESSLVSMLLNNVSFLQAYYTLEHTDFQWYVIVFNTL